MTNPRYSHNPIHPPRPWPTAASEPTPAPEAAPAPSPAASTPSSPTPTLPRPLLLADPCARGRPLRADPCARGRACSSSAAPLPSTTPSLPPRSLRAFELLELSAPRLLPPLPALHRCTPSVSSAAPSRPLGPRPRLLLLRRSPALDDASLAPRRSTGACSNSSASSAAPLPSTTPLPRAEALHWRALEFLGLLHRFPVALRDPRLRRSSTELRMESAELRRVSPSSSTASPFFGLRRLRRSPTELYRAPSSTHRRDPLERSPSPSSAEFRRVSVAPPPSTHRAPPHLRRLPQRLPPMSSLSAPRAPPVRRNSQTKLNHALSQEHCDPVLVAHKAFAETARLLADPYAVEAARCLVVILFLQQLNMVVGAFLLDFPLFLQRQSEASVQAAALKVEHAQAADALQNASTIGAQHRAARERQQRALGRRHFC
ncbi:vegetative cell wall protein gp1-like [Ananas comosus]|uniref:Vegetative cell wall protein gp1-like n=1 Tax=Ananas comosus TaxID=4615 RepID=A0A6P5F977_ANACO|nr:vegetative cell wall protein gp1-like [Ananas comosus]